MGRGALRTGRVLLWPALFAVTIIGVVAISILPTRSYLEQRERIASAEEQLASLSAENQQMQQRADRLADPDEIERLARGQYGLVKPGEEVYHVLPPAQDPVSIPDVWPFTGMRERLGAKVAPSGSAGTAPPTNSAPPQTSASPSTTARPAPNLPSPSSTTTTRRSGAVPPTTTKRVPTPTTTTTTRR